MVPHEERANTASFLEEVIKYVDTLKTRNAELEELLASSKKGKAARPVDDRKPPVLPASRAAGPASEPPSGTSPAASADRLKLLQQHLGQNGASAADFANAQFLQQLAQQLAPGAHGAVSGSSSFGGNSPFGSLGLNINPAQLSFLEHNLAAFSDPSTSSQASHSATDDALRLHLQQQLMASGMHARSLPCCIS